MSPLETVEKPSTPATPAAELPERLAAFLEERGKALSPLLILTHDHPDPDALAAAFALSYLARERFGIECRIRHGGIIGRVENLNMVHSLRIPTRRVSDKDFKKCRAVALVDTQPGFANNSLPPGRRADIVIDQHQPHGAPAADLAIVDTTCGATCVLVARALLSLQMEIPPRVATALAYGIMTDTLELYRAPRPDVVATYLGILARADMKVLGRIRNPSRSRAFFVTLSRGLRRARMRGRLVVAHLHTVKNPDLVSEMAELFLTYRRARWSFCTGRYKGRLHVSLRSSQEKSDAGEVLRDIAVDRSLAGGHGAIAGGAFKVGKDLDDPAWSLLEAQLEQRLARRLRISSRAAVSMPFHGTEAAVPLLPPRAPDAGSGPGPASPGGAPGAPEPSTSG